MIRDAPVGRGPLPRLEQRSDRDSQRVKRCFVGHVKHGNQQLGLGTGHLGVLVCRSQRLNQKAKKAQDLQAGHFQDIGQEAGLVEIDKSVVVFGHQLLLYTFIYIYILYIYI